MVIKELERAALEKGVRKKDIAQNLGVNPSQISRWLSGPANWENDTISDLLYAVGAEPETIAVQFSVRERQKSNRYHPLGEDSAPLRITSIEAANPEFEEHEKLRKVTNSPAVTFKLLEPLEFAT